MNNKIKISHDKKGNVLDMSLGKPKKAISYEIADDVFIRADPKSNKIVGFSILNFVKTRRSLKSKKKIDPLPLQFKSYKEAGEFWDKHDATDYLNFTRTVIVKFMKKRSRV